MSQQKKVPIALSIGLVLITLTAIGYTLFQLYEKMHGEERAILIAIIAAIIALGVVLVRQYGVQPQIILVQAEPGEKDKQSEEEDKRTVYACAVRLNPPELLAKLIVASDPIEAEDLLRQSVGTDPLHQKQKIEELKVVLTRIAPPRKQTA